jgi:hypothetical protein
MFATEPAEEESRFLASQTSLGMTIYRPRKLTRSDVFELGDRPFVGDVAGVQSRFRFDEDDVDFLVRHGAMLDAAGDDDEFAGANYRLVVSEFHAQRALRYEKEFVFMVVMMPDEFALYFDDFDLRLVQFADDALFPMVREKAELFTEIDSLHGGS